MKRAFLIAVLILVGAYVGDDLSLRLRIPSREPFATVQVRPYYAVPLKNHKTEFMRLEPEARQCVQSLFPHFGYSPCWYIKRHLRQQINM